MMNWTRMWAESTRLLRSSRGRRLALESLEQRMMLDGAPQVLISEFLAANRDGLRDENGDASDWIEIHNPTPATINLEGWHLSDNDDQLDKWTFPSVDIPPGGFLVVFASKKDRADVGSPFHTNFQLSSGGEYLALTQPDLTIASEFGEEYPTQFANTSYGLVADSSATVLLDTNADATVLIPTDGSLGTSWTGAAEPFDDSAWTVGKTGIGFDLETTGQIPDHLVGYWPLDESADDISGNRADAILNGTTFDTNVPGVIGAGASLQLDGTDDSVDLGDVGLTSGSIAMWIYPTDVGAGLGDRRLLSPASGAIAQGGALGIDPGSSLGDGSVWVWDRGNWLRLTDNGVLQVDRWQHIALVAEGGEISLYVDGTAHNTVTSSFDFNGPNMLVGAPFLQTYGNPFAGNIDDLSLWDTALTTTEIASLAAGSPPSGLGGLAPLIGTDLETLMHGVNASAYLRTEFEVTDPASLVQLILQMKYDDGFVAYLNGQEVARQNMTGQAAWNQPADQPGEDEEVIRFHDIDISQHLPLLVPGTNVLAIQGLNASAADEDFLILPRLVDRGDGFLPGLVRYSSEPTPGAQNGVVAADVGPIIGEVSQPAGAIPATDELLVTATITPTCEDSDEVFLYYRVMFGQELSIPMLDDGAHADGLAGDGIFGATIPAGVASAGQMLRYRVAASDDQGNTSRWPLFADPLNTPEYLGTMVEVSVATSLPVLHWFTENPSAAQSAGGSRASLFLDGEFYDNVWVHGRGAGGTGAGLKFEMNRGFDFRHSPDAPRFREFNTRSSFGEIAELVSYELYRDAQSPTPAAFPMRFHRNGSFAGVDLFIQQVDKTLLERNDLDGNGALFEMFNSLTHPVNRSYSFYRNDNTKRNREWDPTWDLDALVAGVNEGNPDRYQYVMDNVNVPAMINYLAATVISGDYDHETHNYFVYRDNEGTGRWQFIPWDRNIAFITATNDPTAHPFLGSSEYVHPPWARLEGKSEEQWNRLTDAIYDNPVTREMYLRRLRTLMDELLQPPGTPLAQRKLETRLDELSTLLQSDDASLASSARSLKSFVAARRNHLYVTHSVVNLEDYPGAAGIPHAQSGNPQIDFGQIDFNPVSGNQDEEYMRLDNSNGVAVDISNWRLAGGVQHTFRPNTVIPAGGSLYVTPDVLAFLARTTGPSGGQELLVQGNYDGHLSNAGETIQLVAPDGQIVATVVTPAEASDAQLYLRVSEVHYNPPGSGDLTEFIELHNMSQGGEAVLLDVAYPSVDPAIIAGQFVGNLSNGGERIHVDDDDGGTVIDCRYNDGGSWPGRAAGKGASLEVVDTEGNYDLADNWRSSSEYGGSPGAVDLVVVPAQVAGRYVFYHNSSFSGDAAIAPTPQQLLDAGKDPKWGKQALRSGETATFQNYSTYSLGLNGIVVDVVNLPAATTQLTTADFQFRVGNSSDLATWSDPAATPAPENIALDTSGAGPARATITWANGAIGNEWLQVTVKATAYSTSATPPARRATRLAAPIRTRW